MAEKKPVQKTSRKKNPEKTEEKIPKEKKASSKKASTDKTTDKASSKVGQGSAKASSKKQKTETKKEEKIPAKETFSNEEVTVHVEKKPGCLISFEVEIHSPLRKKAEEQAFKQVRKEVEIPGFRKGKAPKDLIEKKYAPSIASQAKNDAADLAFQSALKLTQIPLLNQNTKVHFNIKSYSEESATFLYSYETLPNIPKVDPSGLDLEKPALQEIGEKELDEAVKQMRLFYAKWTPITDRGAEENDYVILDLQTLDEPNETVFSDTRFEVSDSHMASWMKKAILGKKTGEKVEATSEPDENASEEEKASFEKKQVLLIIKKIEAAELPELNEEFAKKAGAENVEKLKEFLQNMLKQKSAEKQDKELREKLNRLLLENFPFDLPRSLIEAEKNHRKNQILRDPSRTKELASMSANDKRSMDEELFRQSEEAVRLFYLSRAIVREENIQISESEVENEARKTLQTFGPVHVDTKKIPEEVFALALSKMILQKAQNFVLENLEKQQAKV